MPVVNSVYNGTESISFLGSKLWVILSNNKGDENSGSIKRCHKEIKTGKLPVKTL